MRHPFAAQATVDLRVPGAFARKNDCDRNHSVMEQERHGVSVRATSAPYCSIVLRISEFHGIAVYMYWNDHTPPHFHAIVGEHDAAVTLDGGIVIAGYLPTPALALVRKWARLRRAELAANSAHAGAGEPLRPITPLE